MTTDPTVPQPTTNDPGSGDEAATPAHGSGPDPLRRAGLILGIGAVVLGADIATKTWAVHSLRVDPISLLGGVLVLTEGRNPGAAFGFGRSLTPLLSAFALAVVAGLVVAAHRPHSRRVALVLGLGLGGAAGNVTDRLFRSPGPMRGHVVDWIDIGSWPTFNLADSALMTALGVGVLLSLRAPATEPGP